MSHYELPACLRVQGASPPSRVDRHEIAPRGASPMALWAAASVFVTTAVGGVFAFAARRSGAAAPPAATRPAPSSIP